MWLDLKDLAARVSLLPSPFMHIFCNGGKGKEPGRFSPPLRAKSLMGDLERFLPPPRLYHLGSVCCLGAPLGRP